VNILYLDTGQNMTQFMVPSIAAVLRKYKWKPPMKKMFFPLGENGNGAALLDTDWREYLKNR